MMCSQLPDMLPVQVDDIRIAHDRISNHVRCTPVVTCNELDRQLGAQVFLKCENLQVTGSFKARGACNFLLSLSDDQARQGVVTHSSGNHAAAVALHFMDYNFARIHQTLRVTPAMEAGVANHVWTVEEIVGLLGC